MLNSAAHVIFDDLPVRLGEDFYAIVAGQAVAVEPFGVDQRLLGQLRVDQAQRDADLALKLSGILVEHAHRHGIFARGKPPIGRKVEPERFPVSGDGAQAVGWNLHQRVGIEARLGVVEVVVVRAGQRRHAHRNVFHAARAEAGLHGRVDFQAEGGTVGGAIQIAEGDLEGDHLVEHSLEEGSARLRGMPWEDLGDGGEDA